MKKNLICVLLGLACFSAVAADSVELKVTGTLVNGACTPTLDNNGAVNFGNIPVGNLSKTATNQLGSKNINLTITCEQPMPIGFTTLDNRNATTFVQTIANANADNSAVSAAANQYGLGKTAGGINLGSYSIATLVNSATVDGVAVDVLSNGLNADTNPRSWSKSVNGSTGVGTAGAVGVMTAATQGTLVPMAGKVFVYPLKVSAAVQGTDVLAITDNTDFDGSTTISLVYL
ncbi:DUF1120 domain-containing protein [Buttiauxella izardii]|uniref:DUF1120 domain-containing protein n=1 Tax=Buttiauxella izardii TaxID=82991 RepID=A0A3A5JYI5_9ENTR|nr:DUF1120 domain-containing protein [Buttiauxella izardii]RJT27898.1 DUF1120 domain-containing protein [Buttiauxella izardii]